MRSRIQPCLYNQLVMMTPSASVLGRVEEVEVGDHQTPDPLASLAQDTPAGWSSSPLLSLGTFTNKILPLPVSERKNENTNKTRKQLNNGRYGSGREGERGRGTSPPRRKKKVHPGF